MAAASKWSPEHRRRLPQRVSRQSRFPANQCRFRATRETVIMIEGGSIGAARRCREHAPRERACALVIAGKQVERCGVDRVVVIARNAGDAAVSLRRDDQRRGPPRRKRLVLENARSECGNLGVATAGEAESRVQGCRLLCGTAAREHPRREIAQTGIVGILWPTPGMARDHKRRGGCRFARIGELCRSSPESPAVSPVWRGDVQPCGRQAGT